MKQRPDWASRSAGSASRAAPGNPLGEPTTKHGPSNWLARIANSSASPPDNSRGSLNTTIVTSTLACGASQTQGRTKLGKAATADKGANGVRLSTSTHEPAAVRRGAAPPRRS